MGHEPRTSFAALVEKGEMVLIRLDEKLRAYVKWIIHAQENLLKEAVDRITSSWERERKVLSRGELPDFSLGGFVLVARRRKAARNEKLVSEWTGPWGLVSDDREHVYTIEHTVSGETRDAHIASMRFHAHRELRVARRLQNSFQHLERQEEFHISGIVSAKTLHERTSIPCW